MFVEPPRHSPLSVRYQGPVPASGLRPSPRPSPFIRDMRLSKTRQSPERAIVLKNLRLCMGMHFHPIPLPPKVVQHSTFQCCCVSRQRGGQREPCPTGDPQVPAPVRSRTCADKVTTHQRPPSPVAVHRTHRSRHSRPEV